MRAEVIAVGDELICGAHVDTNSAWVADRLTGLGVDVTRHTVVGDAVDDIVAAIREAAARADAVLVCGGLGPTPDDRTRVAAAAVAGVELERRSELAEHVRACFTRSGRVMPEGNLVQADVPRGARVLAPVGTAAGFEVGVDGTPVCCLPGVPEELREMVDTEVVPRFAERADLEVTVSRLVRTAGMAESAVAERCGPVLSRLEAEGAPVTLAFLASGGETRVRVLARGADRTEAAGRATTVVDELVERLGAGVAGVDDEGVEHAVARELRRLGWTLAVAESVTGGRVGERLVAVAGASEVFVGGMIAYTEVAKVALAGIDPADLDRHGPVSEACATALAAGARDRLAADVGLAVVGVAGPTAHGDQPVGTVCLALALPDGTTPALTRRLPARDRVALQRFAASAALDYLRRRLGEATAPAA